MKILSWNIACLPNYCNIFSNPINRIPRILNIIEKHDADIICLQEVFDKKIRKIIIDYFKEKYNYYYTVNFTDGNVSEGVPLIWKPNNIFIDNKSLGCFSGKKLYLINL